MSTLVQNSYIDLEMPWWPQSLSDDLIIENPLYFISGYISMKLLQYTYCMYFNKTIAGEWNVPDLYQLVLDGKWTLDKYIEIASTVSADLNGDGKFTKDDLYGTLNNHYCDVRFACYELPISTQADDGTLQLSVMTERFIDVYNKLYSYYYSSDSVIRHTDNKLSISMFSEDHLLFYPYLCASENSGYESDYGFILIRNNEEQRIYTSLMITSLCAFRPMFRKQISI